MSPTCPSVSDHTARCRFAPARSPVLASSTKPQHVIVPKFPWRVSIGSMWGANYVVAEKEKSPVLDGALP